MRLDPSSTIYMSNLDQRTVQSFGREWSRFDQSEVQEAELSSMWVGAGGETDQLAAAVRRGGADLRNKN